MLMLNPIGSHVIHLFSIFAFLYLNSPPPPLSHSQKIIKLFFSLLIHTYYYIFSNLLPFFLSLYLPITLNFTITLYSSFLYFDSSSPHFILYKFDIIFLIRSIFFPQQNVSTLSLSRWIFVLSYTSN